MYPHTYWREWVDRYRLRELNIKVTKKDVFLLVIIGKDIKL
jgi:hypothetical protein